MRCIPVLVLSSIAIVVAADALAQSGKSAAKRSFPTRPIRLVVGVPAGGSPDLIARAVARQAESYLGQTIVVDNRTGANGIIAATIVANAAPDGYTVLHTAPSIILNTVTYRKLPYDVHRDFVPVTQIAAGVGYLMLVPPSLPVHTVKEFIALAKQKPLRYSSAPIGSTTHLATELFNVRAGLQVQHIPYRGGADAVNAVMSGEVDLTFSPPTAALAFVQAGRMRALAFSGSKRFAKLPDVPLVSEAGVPDYIVDFTWNAWFAPARTPPAIVSELQAAVREAVKTPRMIEFLEAAAFYPVASTPDQFREFVDAEIRRYAQNVRDAKIEPQ